MVNFFEISVAMIYRTDEGLRERGTDLQFTAESVQDIYRQVSETYHAFKNERGAIFCGERFVDIGCIKVWERSVGPLEKGIPSGRRGFEFFEWKYDWGWSFDEAVKIELAKQAEKNRPVSG